MDSVGWIARGVAQRYVGPHPSASGAFQAVGTSVGNPVPDRESIRGNDRAPAAKGISGAIFGVQVDTAGFRRTV